MKRELVYMDAKSSKFWNIELDGKRLLVSFGRVGNKGQMKVQDCPCQHAQHRLGHVPP